MKSKVRWNIGKGTRIVESIYDGRLTKEQAIARIAEGFRGFAIPAPLAIRMVCIKSVKVVD